MAKMWVIQHPPTPKVGDEIEYFGVEVPDEAVELLDGLTLPAGFHF